MDTTEIIKLNLEGEICPYTLILTLKKVQEEERNLREGKKILEVYIDSPATIENIPFELKKRGFNVEIQKLTNLKCKITISNKSQ